MSPPVPGVASGGRWIRKNTKVKMGNGILCLMRINKKIRKEVIKDREKS